MGLFHKNAVQRVLVIILVAALGILPLSACDKEQPARIKQHRKIAAHLLPIRQKKTKKERKSQLRLAILSVQQIGATLSK